MHRSIRSRCPWSRATPSTVLALGMTDRRSGWPLEMVLRAVTAGLKVRNVPVEYTKRSGRSKGTGTIGGTAGTVMDMGRIVGEIR